MSRFDSRYSDSSSFRDRKSDFGGGDYSGGGGYGGGGSGGRGGGGYGGRGGGGDGGGSKRDLDNIALPQQEFENLIPFEKNFFVEHPAVSVLSKEASFPDASSITPSSAGVGSHTLNSPSIIPREGVPIDVSTFGAANTQGRSRAPRKQRSRCRNLCSWLTFDVYSTIIQTILLVVFLPIFRDEPAHMMLQSWVIGNGAGCLLYRIFKCYREQSNRLPQEQPNRLPQVVPVSPGSEVDESQIGGRPRFGIQILKWSWSSLDIFFQLWFGIGLGIVYTHWATTQAPKLNWFCTVCLAITYFRFLLVVIVGILVSIWCGIAVLCKRLARRGKGECEFGTANGEIGKQEKLAK